MNTPVSSATAEATTSGDGGPPPLKSIRLSTATDEGSEGSCPTPTPLQPKPKGVSKGSGGATTSGGKPRGRPPGAKNKVASGGGGEKPPKVKKSAANSQQPLQQQQKKLPIYHNAHKLYQVSFSRVIIKYSLPRHLREFADFSTEIYWWKHYPLKDFTDYVLAFPLCSNYCLFAMSRVWSLSGPTS